MHDAGLSMCCIALEVRPDIKAAYGSVVHIHESWH